MRTEPFKSREEAEAYMAERAALSPRERKLDDIQQLLYDAEHSSDEGALETLSSALWQVHRAVEKLTEIVEGKDE